MLIKVAFCYGSHEISNSLQPVTSTLPYITSLTLHYLHESPLTLRKSFQAILIPGEYRCE